MESNWFLYKSFTEQKEVFVNDTREYLTGYWEVVSPDKRKRLDRILGNIFTTAQSKTYEHGIRYNYQQIDSITSILNADDMYLVFDQINGVFNQE